jgi:hypothetical protein
MNKTIRFLCLAMLCVQIAAGCARAPQPNPQSTPQSADLDVEVLYPAPTTEIQMGQSLKSIVKVTDPQGQVVKDAQLMVSLRDPAGGAVASIPALFGAGDVYRTDNWKVPHKMKAGAWTLEVEAHAGSHSGAATRTFQVNDSIGEVLLEKYGFWVNDPSLGGMQTNLVKEKGDARNGQISWGGIIPAQHVLPESWVEVQWRAGQFKLENPEDVRAFMLGTLGNPGQYATRALESFQKTRFKNWDAWQVKARGVLSVYDEQWMIFYVPEVDKTYALGTTVVLPKITGDPHAYLRDSFEVHPEIQAKGVAPEPLPDLLPPPELISPELGETFTGTSQPIILKWKPVKDLAPDEYYRVSVDYNYAETNTLVTYATRETQFVLPEELLRMPNCAVFNWKVALMQQTGTDEAGQPEGKPASFESLYYFVRWLYPEGEDAPFISHCQNQQF